MPIFPHRLKLLGGCAGLPLLIFWFVQLECGRTENLNTPSVVTSREDALRLILRVITLSFLSFTIRFSRLDFISWIPLFKTGCSLKAREPSLPSDFTNSGGERWEEMDSRFSQGHKREVSTDRLWQIKNSANRFLFTAPIIITSSVSPWFNKKIASHDESVAKWEYPSVNLSAKARKKKTTQILIKND